MLENFVAAASADAVLLTLAPALPDAVPDEPAEGVTPLRVVIMLLKTEFPCALTDAALPIPLTVTWLFAESEVPVVGATAGVAVALLETNEPEITPFAASWPAELLTNSDLAVTVAEL